MDENRNTDFELNQKLFNEAAQELVKAFGSMAAVMNQESKRFNEERQKVKDKLNNGTRITKHRITL